MSRRSLPVLGVAAATVTILTLLIAVRTSGDDDVAKSRRTPVKLDGASRLALQVAQLTRRVEKLEGKQKQQAASEDNKTVKVFALQHADCKSMVRNMQELFVGTKHFGMTYDSRTNSVLAYGAASDMDVIEALLMRLDVPVTAPESTPQPKPRRN